MHPWVRREAEAIARRAERELEALVAVSSPSGDVPLAVAEWPAGDDGWTISLGSVPQTAGRRAAASR